MNPNDILALLLGGGLPTNPMAAALANQPVAPSPVMFGGPGSGSSMFEAATLAQKMRAAEEARSGEEMVNLQTLLTMLSPNMSAEIAAQSGGPGALEATFGLDPDQSSQVIRQALGLQLTPQQMATGQLGIMNLIPEFQKAQASLGQAEAAKTSAGAAVRQAGVAEKEADIKQQTETRLRDAWEKGTPQDRATLYEMNLKNIALTGTMLDGTQVSKDVRQNAYALLKGFSTTPGVTALISELAKEGEWDAAGRLVGLPAGALKNTFWSIGVQVSPEAEGIAQEPAGLSFGASGIDQEALNQQIQQMQEAFQQNFFQLLEKANK